MNNKRNINLVVEDILSEVVLKKIITDDFIIGPSYGKKGKDYIKNKLSGFNNAAKHSIWLVLVDLDNETCPPDLIKQWMSNITKDVNLIFRVAVKEVETWLLADRTNFSKYLGISKDRIRPDVESIQNPKEFIIELAKKSKKRNIKEDIIPDKNTSVKIGKNYNNCLTDFVVNKWDMSEARKISKSLDKTIKAITKKNWQGNGR